VEDIFIVNEDQRAILETVARFVEEEVTPRAAALDADPDPAKGFSWEIVEKAHEVGIRTMTRSEQWGGLGTDSLTTAVVIEELGKGDIGVSVIFAQTLAFSMPVTSASRAMTCPTSPASTGRTRTSLAGRARPRRPVRGS